MTQIEILSDYETFPGFEIGASQINDYNEWRMRASQFIPKIHQRLRPSLIMTAPLLSGVK